MVVAVVSGKLLDVTVRPTETLVGRTEDPKSVLFSVLYYIGGDFLGNFTPTTGSFGGVSRLRFVPGGEGNHLDVVEWPLVCHAGGRRPRSWLLQSASKSYQ